MVLRRNQPRDLIVTDTTSELALVDYLRVIRRRKWVVVLTLLASVGAAMAVTFTSEKVYSSTSRLVLTGQESITGQGALLVRDVTQVETQVEILRSRPVAREVARRLGAGSGSIIDVEVSGLANTKVLRITVESTSPRVARDAANTYAEVYVEQRRKHAVDNALEVVRQISVSSQDVKGRLDDIDAKIAAAQSAPKPDLIELERLRTQRIPLNEQYTTLQRRIDDIQLDLGLQTGAAEVLDPALLPTTPIRPAPVRNALLGFVLGLVLGCGLAVLADYLDDTLKGNEDLERHTAGFTLLGAIPLFGDWRNRGQARLITREDPGAPSSEAYRALRTSIQFMGLRRPLQTVLVTSPMSSEGKSTTLSNLAVTIAQSGRRVVVVDCDLRRPRIHQFFDLPNDVGFTSVLLGEVPVASALRNVPLNLGASGVGASGSLRVLPSGPRPPNPSELLSTPRVAEILASLQGVADMVLIDTPPLLPVTDAVVLSQRVDGVILVATARVTGRREVRRAAELLRQAEAPVLGVVLNGANVDESYGYGYSYRYTYAPDADEGSRKKGGRRSGKAGKADGGRGPASLAQVPGAEEAPDAKDAPRAASS